VDWTAYLKGKSKQTDFGLPIGLELPYRQNHLTFEYIGISLTTPGRVKYQVQLEGFDDNWSPITAATYITYSNLSPGDYTFKVKACNNSGIWNEEPVAYSFRINFPFWQSWWFYLICIIAVAGSLFGFIRLH